MQTQKQTKLFAFKLAEKQVKEAQPAAQWKVRAGVSVAGCSLVDEENLMYRASTRWEGDNGIYC